MNWTGDKISDRLDVTREQNLKPKGDRAEMTKLEQILTKRLAHITERRLDTPIIEQQQMQRGSCKRIGQRYLVRLQNGSYTGAVSLKQAQKLNQGRK